MGIGGHTAAFAAALASGAFALGRLQVDHAVVGERTLILTVDDSIQAPDLAKLRVDGYEIENALFLEEADSGSRMAPGYIDMTDPAQGRILEYAPIPGSVLAEFPPGAAPRVGAVLGDTAFGGLLRKVVEVDPQSRPGSIGRIWGLRTVEAGLPDAVIDCDISFRTRLDFNLALADLAKSQDLAGTLLPGSGGSGDAAGAYGRLDIAVRGAQILFQPWVSGRVRIRDGKVELFKVQVNGDCEVMARLQATLTGAGEFEFEEELPGKAPQILPLGSGLFLRMRQRPFLRVESRSRDESFTAGAEFRIRNSIKGELGFSDGRWRPLAENKMTWSGRNLTANGTEGVLKMAIRPRVEMLLEGANGPVFTFGPYARFVATRASFASGEARPDSSSATAGPARPAAPPGEVSAAPGAQLGHASPAVPSAVPAAPEAGVGGLSDWADRRGAPAAFAPSNREISLGTDIHMETRTTFLGPSDPRDFLLFSREQSVLAPPKEGTLFLREADSSRLLLQCAAYPKADYFIIQQKLGNGAWETVLDKAVAPRIHLSSLKPGGLYRFRAIGVNSLGYGPAFPPEGAAFTAPAANRPPHLPLALLPDSGAVLPDSLPVILSWRGGDPDAGARVQYTLYLDSRFPPLETRVVADTSLRLDDLAPGTYYWKVSASDGTDRSEGTVRSFTVRPAVRERPRPAERDPAYYPLVFVPKGNFRREDGRIVQAGPFFMGKYEVTQAEYEKLTGRNPSYRLQDSLPVDRVTWEEAESFCRETGGRLPTEAEWEYAARAGASSAFFWKGSDPGQYAWYRDNSDNRTQKVGLKRPNAWGLHDMAGNVFEWVQDWYGEYDPADLDHPRGPAAGTAKVIRGASWYSEAASLSLAARYNNRPAFRNFKVGFRCVKDPDPSASADRIGPASLAGASVPRQGVGSESAAE